MRIVSTYNWPLTSEDSMLRFATADTEPRKVELGQTEQMLEPPPVTFMYSTSPFLEAAKWLR
jgi:hypothetical protein